MTTEDKINHRYVLAEQELFQALLERETWYAGEQLGEDPALTDRGRSLVKERMMNCILGGFGQWAWEASQVKNQESEKVMLPIFKIKSRSEP